MCEHERLFELWLKRVDLLVRLGGHTADLCGACGRVVRVRIAGSKLLVYGAFDWPKDRRFRKVVIGQAIPCLAVRQRVSSEESGE